MGPPSLEEEEDLDDENEEDLEEEKDLSDELPSQEVSPRPLTKARNAQAYLVETELRRSNRLKIRNMDSKTSSCGKVSCLGCSNKPPTITSSMIRNLGSELCQIDPIQLTDEILSQKKDVETIGSRKKDVKAKKQRKKKDDDKEDQ